MSDATGCPVGRAPQAQGAEGINRNERHKRQRNAATIEVTGQGMLRFIPRPPAFVGVNLNSVVVFAWVELNSVVAFAWVEMDSNYHLRCTF